MELLPHMLHSQFVYESSTDQLGHSIQEMTLLEGGGVRGDKG